MTQPADHLGDQSRVANAQTAMRSMLKADARVSQNLFSEHTSRQFLRIAEPKVTSLTALVRQVRRSHRWEKVPLF